MIVSVGSLVVSGGVSKFDTKVIAGLVAVACMVAGGTLAWHHPIAPVLASIGFGAWIVVVLVVPAAWLFLVPALLPVIDFAPWTGWLTFEEFDLLLFGALAGAYAHLAGRPSLTTGIETEQPGRPVRLSVVMLIGVYLVLQASSAYRGIEAAGGWQFGWFQGYREPMNSVRLLKSFVFAILFMPLLLIELRRPGYRAARVLACGMTVGLAFAAMTTVWERFAFTDLLNFSTDYRTTGLFWEMHVGGAALDGFLALTVPFVFWWLRGAMTSARVAVALVVGGLAAYACLTSFSRGLYLAIAVSIPLLVLLRGYSAELGGGKRAVYGLARFAIVGIVAMAGSYIVFRAGGYRSLAAVGVAFALTMASGPLSRAIGIRDLASGIVSGAILGASAHLLGPLLTKGPYVLFGVLAIGCAAAIAWHRSLSSRVLAVAAIAAYVGTLVAAVSIAGYWGGHGAQGDAATVAGVLLVLWLSNRVSPIPILPAGLPQQGALLLPLVLASAVVAVFSGGSFINERFAIAEQDLDVRVSHWKNSVKLMSGSSDWLIGKGLGRFSAEFALHFAPGALPGSHRIESNGGERFLSLTGPGREGIPSELLRVVQRVLIVPGTQHIVVFDARSREGGQLYTEVCEKHLLYSANCVTGRKVIPASDGGWKRYLLPLQGPALNAGPAYAPRLGLFALSVESPAHSVDIDNVSLITADGRNLIENGDWSNAMAHWLFTSEGSHLPFHMNNIFLHVLFEQGALGLLAFVCIVGAALTRLMATRVRYHPLAPFLVAGIVGFLVVGMFDSLLDAPRVAFLFWILVLLGLVLPADMFTTRRQ